MDVEMVELRRRRNGMLGRRYSGKGVAGDAALSGMVALVTDGEQAKTKGMLRRWQRDVE